MNKIYIISDTFNPEKLKQLLTEQIQESKELKFQVEENDPNNMDLDPTILGVLIGAGSTLLGQLITGIFGFKIKDKEIKAQKEIKDKEIKAQKDIKDKEIQAQKDIKDKEIQAQAENLIIIFKDSDGNQYSFPRNMPLEELEQIREKLSNKKIETIAILKS